MTTRYYIAFTGTFLLASMMFLNQTITILLGVLVSSVVVYCLSAKLSQQVQNNFQADETWNPDDELALVTGGSGAIGKRIMEDLSKHIRVVVLDIVQPDFELPENVTFYQVDISSTKSIFDAASDIRILHGEPTIIVNNAGVFHHGTILGSSEEDLRRTFDVNIVSHFLILKEFLPSLIQKNRGHVVTMASVASFVAVGEMVDYCCSKASALAFHEGLRQELKYWYQAPNVRTSIVHPLWVETPLIEGFTRYQNTFRQPIMNPRVVSEAVLEHIITRKSGQIVLPGHLSVAGALRALPLWLQEPVRSFFSKVVRRVSDVRSAEEN
ncbi:unnamed protein product [Penicillium olsonii]|nr:unnamed protein product [Penicillium olsonii]CAG7931847.1 unnamed protein product [Penicillium olsonii]